MNNWKEEYHKLLKAHYVWTWDLIKELENFIDNLIKKSKEEWMQEIIDSYKRAEKELNKL